MVENCQKKFMRKQLHFLSLIVLHAASLLIDRFNTGTFICTSFLTCLHFKARNKIDPFCGHKHVYYTFVQQLTKLWGQN